MFRSKMANCYCTCSENFPGARVNHRTAFWVFSDLIKAVDHFTAEKKTGNELKCNNLVTNAIHTFIHYTHLHTSPPVSTYTSVLLDHQIYRTK